MVTYKLIWDDFCSWYLEIVKPAYQKPIDKATYEKTISFFEDLMKVVHPFTPFITEEIWHLLKEREEGDDIIIASMPKSNGHDKEILKAFERAEQVILGIRNIRQEKNIPNKDSIDLVVKKGDHPECIFYPVISKLGNLNSIQEVDEKPENVMSFIVGAQEFYVPFSADIDVEAEIAKLQEELNYTEGFLRSVMKKLSNERFVKGAPEAVVAKEKKKQTDAENRIKVIKEQLANLK
jgi:valyl-tRNA synthetase